VHSFNISYNIPINKIPLLDWTSANARYNGTYGWGVGPIIPDDPVLGPINLGNDIKNSNTIQLNGQLNLVNLYNKVGYLKDINDKYRNARSRQRESETRTKTKVYSRDGLFLREGSPRFVTHNLRTEQIDVEVLDENGQVVEVVTEILSDTRIRITSERAIRAATINVTGTIEKGESPLKVVTETSVRILMGLRTVNVTYSKSGGTLLPGYLPGVDYFGVANYRGNYEPGFAFMAGWQDPGYAEDAFNRGLLTLDQSQNNPYNMNNTERFTLRANIEPFNGLKIDLTANRQFASNLTEYYTALPNGSLPSEDERGRVFSGNFSMSYISLGTSFEKINDQVESSTSFRKLKEEYRIAISQRLGQEYTEATGIILPPDSTDARYVQGYGPTSQAVLIPSFLAAYGNQDVERITLQAIRSILQVLPNWQVRFDGLGKMPALQDVVNSVVINHSYRSTYSIGSFINNPYYYEAFYAGSGVTDTTDLLGNFMVESNVNTVSINENFSPLIGLNMDWKNSLTTRIEYKRSRTVAMNMANTQVNEVNSGEFVIGGGYRFNQVPLEINQRSFQSDINVRLDLSMRNNRTVIRKLEDLSGSEITAGQRIFSLKASADYMLGDKFTIRAFYDQRLTTPYISNSYPNANYNVGLA
jgi:cell surface protein SprA